MLKTLPTALFFAAFLLGSWSSASAAGPAFALDPAFYSPSSPAPAAAPNSSRTISGAAPEWHPPMYLQDACDTDNDTFLPGEKITYKLYYNWNFVWLAAGEVVFKVHDLPDQYHITVTGTTYESYEWFYKVRDRYESYISKETLLPEIHIKDVQEGGYLRYDRTTFDQIDHKAISARGRTRDELKSETIDFEGCMHDIISTVYWARNLKYEDMTVNQEIPIKIMMDRKIYPLKVKYLGPQAETDVKGVGTFKTQEFSPQLIAGDVFKEGDEMKIFVTDDKNKIPVLIESPVVVGSVKAVLHKYEGLKYPMTAKVD